MQQYPSFMKEFFFFKFGSTTVTEFGTETVKVFNLFSGKTFNNSL